MCAVLDGRDALVVLPTGYGKSLIYQVPALLGRTPTIVVSPLIALMVDQERKLASRGAPVVRIDSTLGASQRRAAVERVRDGGPLVVLTTPETLGGDELRDVFAEAYPWLLCVDEAHSISEWGHDFRPAYLRLKAARERLGNPVVLALTATATPRVRGDVAEQLGLVDPALIVAPPNRDNLRLSVEIVAGTTKVRCAGRMLKRLERPGIVYCSTTIEVDRLHRALDRARVPVARYHGKMNKGEREAAQRRFMRPSKRLVMIATSAFGMGIDKPNIRYIIHYQAPGSLEQYVQEAGRAGRDGKPARCVLLFDEADLEIQRHLSARGKPGLVQAREDARRLAALEAYANTEECRSVFIRRYFGEPDPPRCGRCDRCRKGREPDDQDEALREITRAGLRGEARVGERLPERSPARSGGDPATAKGRRRGPRKRGRRGKGRGRGPG